MVPNCSAQKSLPSDQLNTYFMTSGVNARGDEAESSLTFTVEDITSTDNAAAEDVVSTKSDIDWSMLIMVIVGGVFVCLVMLWLKQRTISGKEHPVTLSNQIEGRDDVGGFQTNGRQNSESSNVQDLCIDVAAPQIVQPQFSVAGSVPMEGVDDNLADSMNVAVGPAV